MLCPLYSWRRGISSLSLHCLFSEFFDYSRTSLITFPDPDVWWCPNKYEMSDMSEAIYHPGYMHPFSNLVPRGRWETLGTRLPFPLISFQQFFDSGPSVSSSLQWYQISVIRLFAKIWYPRKSFLPDYFLNCASPTFRKKYTSYHTFHFIRLKEYPLYMWCQYSFLKKENIYIVRYNKQGKSYFSACCHKSVKSPAGPL